MDHRNPTLYLSVPYFRCTPLCMHCEMIVCELHHHRANFKAGLHVDTAVSTTRKLTLGNLPGKAVGAGRVGPLDPLCPAGRGHQRAHAPNLPGDVSRFAAVLVA